MKQDIFLILKKIVLGLLLVIIPFLIFYAGFWLIIHFG